MAVMEKGFGISVDLSEFFSDARARCVVWVPAGGCARGRRVRWLARRLRRRLRLPAEPALIAPQGLMHPRDPLTLLRPDDTVKAVQMGRWFNSEASSSEENDLSQQEVTCASPLRIISPIANSAARDMSLESPSKAKVCFKSPDASPHPSSPPSGALQNMKQQALDLLKQYAISGLPAMGVTDPPPAAPAQPALPEPPGRKRRRRVRRRPRHRDGDLSLSEVPSSPERRRPRRSPPPLTAAAVAPSTTEVAPPPLTAAPPSTAEVAAPPAQVAPSPVAAPPPAAQVPPPAAQVPPPPMAAPPPPAPPVLRNASDRAPTPRLVRALCG